jgi:SAM-dependent methyltransferase
VEADERRRTGGGVGGLDPLFFELHSGLAHEAPGSAEDTLQALALTGLRGPLRMLDAGSGPGAASLMLLDALPWAEVTAVDLHAPFLEAAAQQAATAGHAARFRTLQADMAALPFPPRSFDLVWSEGAAYSVGVPVALAHWKALLAPGGRIAFSEAVWRTAAPHARARAFWTEYPAMTDAEGVRRWIARAGLRSLGEVEVSQAGWAAYYEPLERRVAELEAVHGADHPVLAATREEIAVWRAHGADYAYRFFVAGR